MITGLYNKIERFRYDPANPSRIHQTGSLHTACPSLPVSGPGPPSLATLPYISECLYVCMFVCSHVSERAANIGLDVNGKHSAAPDTESKKNLSSKINFPVTSTIRTKT